VFWRPEGLPWRLTGGLLEAYWRLTGGLLEAYWRLTGGLLEVYRRFTGHSLGADWGLTGVLLGSYWGLTGGLLEADWCSGGPKALQAGFRRGLRRRVLKMMRFYTQPARLK